MATQLNFAMTPKPLVSAIVSTYNSERFIRGCLDDLLRQSIGDLVEIVVVVSGSQENETAIVTEYQQLHSNIVLIRTAQRESLYAAWNRGIRASTGKYVANANTDDRLHPQAYERMAAVLDAFPDVALVFADCLETETENETFETTSSTKRYRNTQDHCLYDLLQYCYVGPFPMWRRSLHEDLGWFEEAMKSASDYDFWIRVAAKHKMLHLRETLGLFLAHPGSLSHQEQGADESEQVMRFARETVPIEAVFPGLKGTTDPLAKGCALAAMAELCLYGPWYNHRDLALDFLNRAEQAGASHELVDNNRAVLLPSFGRAAEAEVLLERHPESVWLQTNLQQLRAWQNSGAEMHLHMIPVSHPVVEDGRRKFGIDPADIPPLKMPKHRPSLRKQTAAIS